MEDDHGELEAELRQFTGTQKYYRNFTGLLYTDGVRHLAERAGSYWLIDLVGSHQPKLRDVPFQVWDISVNEDRTGLVSMVEDDGQRPTVTQRLPFTDFPLVEFSFYCIDGVMLLKSEY